MTDNHEAPRLFHTLRCRDAEAMIAWLTDVLGFTERVIYRDGGVVMHAELCLGSSILILGSDRDNDYGKAVGPLDGRRTDAVYMAVDDADALHARVKASGAEIVQPPYDTPYGSRDFSARDPEGGLWAFGTYWPKADEPPLDG